jgi:hypothetical protein
MRTGMRRVFVFGGGSILVAGGLFAAACGDSGTTSGALPVAEAGGDNQVPPGPPGPPSGDGGNDSATDPDCANVPKLRTNTTDFYCTFVDKASDAGLADGGDPRYCKNDQICCNPSTCAGGGVCATGATNHDPSYCAVDPTKGTTLGNGETVCKTAAPGRGYTWVASNGGSSWECADKSNCPNTQVCCMMTAGVAPGTPDAGGNVNVGPAPTTSPIPKACNAKQGYKTGGTRCAGACAPNTEIQLCSQTDNSCAAGATCTPFAGFFRDLAACEPGPGFP